MEDHLTESDRDMLDMLQEVISLCSLIDPPAKNGDRYYDEYEIRRSLQEVLVQLTKAKLRERN